MKQRVVVTGIGIYSCLGQDIESVKNSLYNGISGVGRIPGRIEYGYSTDFSGVVPSPNLKGLIDRRLRIGLAQQGEYAFMAVKQALLSANLDEDFISKNETGLIVGNDSSSESLIDDCHIMDQKHDTELLGSSAVFKNLNSTVSMNLSTIFKLKGVNFSLSAACASSSHTIGVAKMYIENNMQERIICVGAQEVNLYSTMSFDALRVFTKYKGDPTKASRPFSVDRDGLVPSGGAAAVILESLESAQKRGAKIYGEIAGYGFSGDGFKISTPESNSTAIAMQRAIDNAGISLKDVDYINAHATSTPIGDAAEAKSISTLFADYKPLVSSTKSLTGHECWMAGTSELIYSLIMMNNDFVAPNINFLDYDEYSSKINLALETKECNIDNILSNSFGFGGTNSCLLIKKYKN